MTLRNWIAFALIVISLICLYPGLFQPILSIKVSTKLPILGEIMLHESTQSIVKTVQTLHENNNSLVAFLILFFSIVVPVVKAVVLLFVLFAKRLANRVHLHRFVYIIGKWSMADVFVVGVFLAYLATRSNESVDAQIHEGFYYFLAYCLISLLAIQVMQVEEEKKYNENKN